MIKNYFLVFLNVLGITLSFGQTFTKVFPVDTVGLFNSNNAWYDFDNDGDLDFIVTGAHATNALYTILYENQGNDKFRQAISPFSFYSMPQYSESRISFLDTNNDDRVDLLLAGRRIGPGTGPLINRISVLENRTTGFADINSLQDFGNCDGFAITSTGDVNNDGTIDIFISGINGYNSSGNPVLSAVLYLNKNNTFVKDASSNFPAVYLGDSKLVDLDSDQDLDLVYSGSNGNQFPYQETYIYINDGAGHFTELSAGLIKLQNSSIDVGDYDGDNDLDILLTGTDGSYNSRTILYKNDANTFTQVSLSASLNRTTDGSAKWGDYDNDGDLDILITGQTGTTPFKLAIFQNQGADQFVEITDTNFEIVGNGSASWGDYDSDGDLDILVTGAKNFPPLAEPTSVLYILKNGTTTKNIAPSAPSNLKFAKIDPTTYKFTWDKATDDHTNQASLTYNLSINNPAGILLHPFSDNTTGKRRISAQGNVGLNTSWIWKSGSLADGAYPIKVQAIDGGLSTSNWGEATIYVGAPIAPINLSFTYNQGNIKLFWEDRSVNEQFFIIERKINDGNFVKLDSVLSNNSTYSVPYSGYDLQEYRVYAVNPNQKSATSNSVKTILNSPSNLTLEDDAKSIKLTWTDNSFNEQFFVIERQYKDGSFEKLDSVAANITSYSYNFSDYGENSFRVHASSPKQKSEYSNTAQIVVTGIESSAETISLYPNPSQNIVTLKNEGCTNCISEIEILNLSGLMVYRNSVELDSNGEAVLNLMFLSPGFYLIRSATKNDTHQILKLVKL